MYVLFYAKTTEAIYIKLYRKYKKYKLYIKITHMLLFTPINTIYAGRAAG